MHGVFSSRTLLLLSPFYRFHLLVRAQYVNNDHHSSKSHSPWAAINGGLLAAVVGVLLIVVYIVCIKYIVYCYPRWSGRSLTSHRAQGGLDASIVKAFPVFAYSSKSGFGPNNAPDECAVCLGPFEEKEKLCRLLKCEHVFHVVCVNRWLAGHTTCPFCRAELATQPSEATQFGLGLVDGPDVRDPANDVV